MWTVSFGPRAEPTEGWTLSTDVETAQGWSAPGLPGRPAQGYLSVPGASQDVAYRGLFKTLCHSFQMLAFDHLRSPNTLCVKNIPFGQTAYTFD